MKKQYLLFLFIALSCRALSQSTAVDWTVPDCNNTSHHLFAELDSGKVIVLMWVMPCGLCIGPALSAYNVVQSFSTSGCDVRYYLVDDYANTNCSTLVSWAATNSIGPNITSFVNAAIDLQDYGFPGMPKVVVLGRNDHNVYYNEDNAVNATLLQNAITQACNDVMNGLSNESGGISGMTISPNPVSQKATLKFSLERSGTVEIILLNILGEQISVVYPDALRTGENTIIFDSGSLQDGIYFVSLRQNNQASFLKFSLIR